MAHIKKNVLTIAIVLFVSFTLSAQTANTIVGKWKVADDTSHQSEIYLAKDGLYYGKMMYEGGRKENIGKLLLKKLKYDEAAKTFKGTMSPPDKDMELSVTISFLSNDKLKIVAKKIFLTKTLYFIRIN